MISYNAKSAQGQLRLSEFEASTLFSETVKQKKVGSLSCCKKHPSYLYLGVWLCDECWHKLCEESE